MGKMSKRKGDSFERQIATKISQWWYNKPDVVRRAPLSGGFSDKLVWGDFIAPEDFPFICSLKKREGWSLEELFSCFVEMWQKRRKEAGNVGILTWWYEVQKEAYKCYENRGFWKYPILVFARNWGPVLVMLRVIDLEQLFPADRPNDLVLFKISVDKIRSNELAVIKLEDFMKNIKCKQGGELI